MAPAGDAGFALSDWRDEVQRLLWRSQKIVPLDAGHSVDLQYRGIACRRALRLTKGLLSAAAAVGIIAKDLRAVPTLEPVWLELRALYELLPGKVPVVRSFAARHHAVPPAPRLELPLPNQLPRGFVDLTGVDLLGTTVLGMVAEVPPASRGRGVHWTLACVCGKPFVRASWEITRAQRAGLRLRCNQNCRGSGTAATPSRAPAERRIIDPATFVEQVIGGAEVLAVLPSTGQGAMLQCKCSCGERFAKAMRDVRAAQAREVHLRCSPRCDGRRKRRAA